MHECAHAQRPVSTGGFLRCAAVGFMPKSPNVRTRFHRQRDAEHTSFAMKTIHDTPNGIVVDAQTYPLELLAATAARLLEGNDYEGAVERAVALLNACKRYQWLALRNKTLMGNIEEMSKERKREETAAKRIPFSAALEKIYGRSRLSRNIDTHCIFTAYRLGLLAEPEAYLKLIEIQKQEGFLPSEVASLTKDYKAIPANEWRGIVDEYKRHRAPIGKSKKAFDTAKKPVSGKKRRVAGKQRLRGI